MAISRHDRRLRFRSWRAHRLSRAGAAFPARRLRLPRRSRPRALRRPALRRDRGADARTASTRCSGAAARSCCSAAIPPPASRPARCRRTGCRSAAGLGRNILGIVAPTVEAATQTPWAVTAPQYPQKYNTDVVAVFGTTRTITSHAYPEEIRKRCPKVTVVQQTCAGLVGAIERAAPEAELDALVAQSVAALLAQTAGAPPHRAILGCTHYPAGRAAVPPPPAAVHAAPVAARGGGGQPRGLPRPASRTMRASPLPPASRRRSC